MVFRLRPHHIDSLLVRKKTTPAQRETIIRATAKLYGDRGFAERERYFIESVEGDTLVKVVLRNDYICTQLKCPFAAQCAAGNYQEVADIIASRLPPGPARELAKQLTPELSDKWTIRRYGLEPGITYKLEDITVVNNSMNINDLV
jgi:hypothetical protein